MNHSIIVRIALFLFLILGITIFVYYYFNSVNDNRTQEINESGKSVAENIALPEEKAGSEYENTADKNTQKPFISPIRDGQERISKKPYGLHVTPQNSPVQPEKFSGYHTGTDFETYPDEAQIKIDIKAICNGSIIYKSRVSGYGGVIIEKCEINANPVTVLYGHLKLSDSPVSVGQAISSGETLASLGAGYSADADGERKHLHLGIHQGSRVELRGYVQNQLELNSWHNPENLIDFGN